MDASSAQVKTVTIKSLDGETPEAFATKAFDYYKLGDKTLNNGVLIMLSEQDKEIYIKVGKGTKKIISDDRAGKILDAQAIPSFKEGNLEDGILNTHKQVVKDLAEHYDVVPKVEGEQYEGSLSALSNNGLDNIVRSDTKDKIMTTLQDAIDLIINQIIKWYNINPWLTIIGVVVGLFMILRMLGRMGGGRSGGYSSSNRSSRSISSNRSSSKRKDSGSGGNSKGGGGAGRSW